MYLSQNSRGRIGSKGSRGSRSSRGSRGSSRREDPVADNETSASTQVRIAKCVFK